MQSMTGYGKGIAEKNGTKITLELKTVNHRFLDWSIKTPRTFLFLEDTIKKQISQKINRGHIDLYLTYAKDSAVENALTVDMALAKDYIEKAQEVAKEFGLENDVTVSSILRNGDIATRESVEESEDDLKELTLSALVQALDALAVARANEGAHILADLKQKLDNMQSALDKIKEFAPKVTAIYRENITARIDEALKENVDQQRLAMEIALFADKCCIDEEMTRLQAHIDLMRKTLESDKPIGRDLDFRIQEMNRETNTIGSKANFLEITAEVLKLKNEIEKLREQVQNVE